MNFELNEKRKKVKKGIVINDCIRTHPESYEKGIFMAFRKKYEVMKIGR
jgi:hypothetical protein